MALVEMENYQPGVNVDRLVSLGALITFVKIQEANRGIKVRTEYDNQDYLENSDNLYKLNRTAFKNIGKERNPGSKHKVRNPYKNLR